MKGRRRVTVGDVPRLRTLVAAESVVLALLLVVSGCGGGGRLSKAEYESRVCDIMIDAEDAESQADPQHAMSVAADELSSISAPPDVEGFHKTLVSEFKKFSATHDDIDAMTQHLAAAQEALSEIRAAGYNVKPGWGTCGTG